MKITEYVKAHPWSSGIIGVVGLIIFVVIVRGGSSSGGAVASGPSDAQVQADATVQAAQIAAQASAAQAGAAVQAAQIGAGVQMNSDNQTAAVYMAQIAAQQEITDQQTAAQKDIASQSIAASTANAQVVTQALPSIKKKDRDNVLQALITGQPVVSGNNNGNSASSIIGSLGNLIGNAGKTLSLGLL